MLIGVKIPVSVNIAPNIYRGPALESSTQDRHQFSYSPFFNV
jgi:hypothetical protein